MGRQLQIAGQQTLPAEEAGDVGLHTNALGIHAQQQMIHGGIGTDAHPEDIPGILEAKNRAAAGPTAPACGLYLNKVFYPDGI